MNNKKAILVVSFGTSFKETREKTIDKIETDIREAFTEYRIYRAFTSSMIIKKLKKVDNYHVYTVKEALSRMVNDGITELVVQPTHIINGIENDIMIDEIISYKDNFKSIKIGYPLLNSTEDYFELIKIVTNEFSYISTNEALVLIGHGSSHYSNSIYPDLYNKFKAEGFNNIFIGTVKGYPSLNEVLNSLNSSNPKKVFLTPLMIVAGNHVYNDMVSDEKNSWKRILINNNFNVECIIKGLGEYASIRKMFIEHIKDASEITQ